MPSAGLEPPAEPQRAGQPWTRHGLISNESLAKQLAREVLRSTFGHEPYPPMVARLDRGVWHIEGGPFPPDTLGGNLYIQICQSNGRVLNLYGTQ